MGLDLLLMLSLGRSGSTFLAKAISENSAYQNAGENRYFWQELVKKPPEAHPVEITRFFTRKCPDGDKILDKTPELYRHLAEVNFGPHRVKWIELKRRPEAIELSRTNFLSVLRQPKRWMMRVRQYRRDYGVRWYIPIMQRWFFLSALLGYNSRKAFSTNARVANAAQEREGFDVVVANIRKRAHVVTIDYDAFDQTVLGLTAIGFSHEQIAHIHSYFKR